MTANNTGQGAKPHCNVGRRALASEKDKDRAFSALLEEYKILKAEVYQTSESSSRAISYIQIYGGFIILLTGAYFGGIRLFLSENQRIDLPQSIWFVSISCAAVFLFMLYSNTTHASWKFRILRERLAQIEDLINFRTKTDFFVYERNVAKRAFSYAAISGSIIAPNAWTRVFTFILFTLGVTVLIIISSNVFYESSPDYLMFTTATLLFMTAVLIVDDIRINKFFSIQDFINDLQDKPNPFRAALPYVSNYIAFMLIFYTLFATSFGSPSHSAIASAIEEIFRWLRTVGEIPRLLIIFIYEALCGSFLFTPTELPLKLVDEMNLLSILMLASIGKGVGAGALFLLSRWYLFRNLETPTRRVNEFAGGLLARFQAKIPLSAIYFASQAIPFAPMRSATIAYAAVAPQGRSSLAIVMIGSATGTASRMLIISWLMGIVLR